MNKEYAHTALQEALDLLQQLIAIPSLSREEDKTADLLQQFFQRKKIFVHRSQNNIWCCNKFFDPARPTILLNSHHDTVPPAASYKRHPFTAEMVGDKLFGLGSTDAGASLVSLAVSFVHFYDQKELAYNIVFAATAEEEISGVNGIESLFSIPTFKNYFQQQDSFAIVGEPTQLQPAIAEKGLLVLDCTVYGVTGHAARNEGVNAIYKALDVVEWFRNYRFEKVSHLLGEVTMNVTSINAENKAHNVVPGSCSFIVDVRITELYSHEEVMAIIRQQVDCEIKPRSTRLRSSFISEEHPVVKAAVLSGKKVFGSPTLSDKALIPLPALKCGPGNSAQSHTADEYVLVPAIAEGISFYQHLLKTVLAAGTVPTAFNSSHT